MKNKYQNFIHNAARKTLAIFVMCFVLFQSLVAPFADNVAFATPAENPHISATATTEEKVQDTSKEDASEKPSTEVENPNTQEFSENIETPKTEEKISEGVASAVDFSTAENTRTSMENVLKNATEKMNEAIEKLPENIEKISENLNRLRSAATFEPSTSGATDLSIKIDGQTEAENNRYLINRITVSNLGPADAHGSNLKITLPAGMRKVSLVCVDATSDAVCPDTETYSDDAREINRRLDKLPVLGVLNFELRAKLPLNPPTSVNFTTEVTVPAGMTDSNDRSNVAILNTRIVQGSADVLVSQFTQGDIENMQPRAQNSEANDGSQEIVFDNPQPISYTIRYENKGVGYADGAGIGFAIDLGAANYEFSKKIEYSDLKISCTPNGEAVCPTEFKNTNNQENPVNGWLQTGGWRYDSVLGIFSQNYTKVPDLPAHSSIDVTVTFTPKKISMTPVRSHGCFDLNLLTTIQPNFAEINNISQISDPVTNNKLNTDALKQLTPFEAPEMPTLDRICPKADLAVTAISQNTVGEIATTSVPSENGFGQDLVVTNPKEMTFTVKYENKWPVEVENARFQMTLGMSSHTRLDYENLSFECTTTGWAECPLAYRKAPNTSYEASGTFDLYSSSYNYFYLFNSNIGAQTWDVRREIIPRMPANSSVTITLKFTPKKFRDYSYSTCGTRGKDIYLKWHEAKIGIQDYDIAELNTRNNWAYESDRSDAITLESIKTSDISNILFGRISQKNCAATDLAVTEVSQSFVGDIETEILTADNGFYTYPRVKNPEPISFTAKYENIGQDAADNAKINFELATHYSSNNSWVHYRDLKIDCTTTGWAECPVEFVNFNENKAISKEGNIHEWGTNFINKVAPKFPAGATMTIKVTLTPEYAHASYGSCWTHYRDNAIFFKYIGIWTPSNVAEQNDKNNYYVTFDKDHERSFQRISTGDIGVVNIGRTTQIQDACKRSGVTIDVEHNNREPDRPMADGKTFEFTAIYKNNSDVNVENVKIFGRKKNIASYGDYHHRNSLKIDYSHFEVTCEGVNGGVCPNAQPHGDERPYNHNIDQSSGEWNYTDGGWWNPQENKFWDTTIPSLPARSEVRMKVKYTLSNPHDIVINHENIDWLSYENFYVKAELNQNKFTSNDGTLSRDLNLNHIWMNDTYINNKFVERNPGDGECENPNLMNRDGTSETAPGKNMCAYVEVGNAGVAHANYFDFRSTIPNGLTNIDVSSIKCIVLTGEREGTKCGEDFYFDPDTRILSGKIEKMTVGGKVMFMVPGRTVDYSSSWKSINTVIPPSGWHERLPDTNRSEQSFSIKGTDPSITKSSSVRTAMMGDEFTYTITARNPDSGESLKKVRITDFIPNSFYYAGTRDIVVTGGASAESKEEKPSLIEEISGQNISVDESIDGWKRPIRNTDNHIEWGTFNMPVNSSVTISFKVRVKESYSCSEVIHNSAYLHYSLQNNIASTRVYDGTLIGFETDDVELIGCKELTAHTDIVELSGTVRNGKATLVPDTYNILENDTVYSPALTQLNPRESSIKIVNIRQLNKQLLYAGASTGISSKGIKQMTGGFKYGNRLEGIGGVTPIDKNTGITIFDYNELPDLNIDEKGNITWKKNLSTGVYLGAYEVCDKVNTLNCSMAPIVVKVPNAANNPPTAVADSAKTLINTTIDIDILKNDTDPDDDILVIESVENEQNGTFTIENRKIKFTPAFDFVGEATAEYTINDGMGGTSKAKILVLVERNANLPPVAVNDSDLTNMNEAITINALENDSDPEDQEISLKSVSVVNDSGVAIIKDSKVVFTPKQDFVGIAVLSYTITDTEETEASAVIIIRVVNNTAPTAQNDLVNTLKNEEYTIDVLANDTDPENDPLIVETIAGQTNGQFIIRDNKVHFIPTKDFIGEARARYGIFDGTNGRSEAEIIVTISENIPPVAVDDKEIVEFDESKDIFVLANDSDPRNNPLTITNIEDEVNGRFVISGDKVTFTPNKGFHGEATARYTISNGQGGNASATITVIVKEAPLPPPLPNNPPMAQNDERTTSINQAIDIDVLSNDSDPDYDVLSITSISNQTHGQFIQEGNKVRFIPEKDFVGNATAIYTINDGKGGVAMATIVVIVQAEPTYTVTETLTKKGKFFKESCDPDTFAQGVEFTHSITEVYTSKISLEDAREKVRAKLKERMDSEFDALGQDYAEKNDVCKDIPTYAKKKTLTKSAEVTRNNCEPKTTTKPVTFTYTIEETYVSRISEDDADYQVTKILEKRMAEEFDKQGQIFANENGVCEKIPEYSFEDSLEKTGEFTKVCQPNQVTKPVKFTHKITEKFVSEISLEDAQEKVRAKLKERMDSEFDALGQDYAEKNGVCDNKPSTPNKPSTSGSTGSGGDPTPNPPSNPTIKPPVPTVTPPKDPELPDEPLFSAPVINGQCVSAVKNLDDPKLIAYYDDLKIMNRDNVHRQLTRVEFVKLVLNAGKVDLEQEFDRSNLDDFRDIDTESWYASYVSYIIHMGAMSGQTLTDENGNEYKIFRPNDTITRAEASKILSELVLKKDQKLPSLEEIISFEDVEPIESLSAYIQFAYNSCLLHGRNTIDGQPIDGQPRVFEPYDNITLAETSKVLYNITHSNVNSDEKFLEMISDVQDLFFSKNTSKTHDASKWETTSTGTTNSNSATTSQWAPAPLLVPTLNLNGNNFGIQNLVP